VAVRVCEISSQPEYQVAEHRHEHRREIQTIYWWEWGTGSCRVNRFWVWPLDSLAFLLQHARSRRGGPDGPVFHWAAPGVCKARLAGGMGGGVPSGLEGARTGCGVINRLATHLGLAFVIFGFITWYTF